MQMEYNSTNHVKNLPDAYKKTADSNNSKILEIESTACNKVRNGLWGLYKCGTCKVEIPHGEQICPICNKKGVLEVAGVYDILDLNNAKGKTLDLYGERVGQPRGVANDEKYLLMIKAKIMRNLANGSHESIVNAICATLDCKPSQVILEENEEGNVELSALPLETIANSGLTTSQFIAILKSMLPIGVPLSYFNLEGTFALSESEEDMKVDGDTEGLTDIEENMKIKTSIGGFLGAGQGDENDDTLPI